MCLYRDVVGCCSQNFGSLLTAVATSKVKALEKVKGFDDNVAQR